MDDAIKKLIKDLKDEVEIIGHKVKDVGVSQGISTHNISFMRDQQSVINEKLDHLSKVQDEHTDKIDTLLGDMIDVQKKTGATYDLAKATYENNRREIDEIKEHLNLSVNPSPFK